MSKPGTQTDREPIAWRGQLVGYILDPKIDNFDVYGRWTPVFPSAQEFIRVLQQCGEVVVRIGNKTPEWLGTVEELPDTEINIRVRPNLRAEVQILPPNG
jgi:hypothetical protein